MTDRLDEMRERAARDWMGCTRTRVESDARDLLGEVERLKALYDAAQDYIDHSPCDPDIYPEQAKAWIRLQDLQQQSKADYASG